jgi:hypothetical protein
MRSLTKDDTCWKNENNNNASTCASFAASYMTLQAEAWRRDRYLTVHSAAPKSSAGLPAGPHTC